MIITVTLNTSVDKTVQVPGFAVGGTLSGKVLRRRPAGKGINVSRCLAELGHRSIATGFVGEAEGLLFAPDLSAAGVLNHLVGIDGRTRDNITYLDPETGTETHIREEGFEVSGDDLKRLEESLISTVQAGELVIFAGSVPPGLAADALANMVEGCRARGGRVCVDCNGDPFIRAVDAGPMLIKPNLNELQELTGKPASSAGEAASVAGELLDRVSIVLVSMGAGGAVCVSADGVWHARGVVTGIVNTVGCGDALLAGFAAAIEDSASLDECLRLGVACGGASALCNIAGELHRHDIDDLLRSVEVTRVSRG